jgi:hypothetical protein
MKFPLELRRGAHASDHFKNARLNVQLLDKVGRITHLSLHTANSLSDQNRATRGRSREGSPLTRHACSSPLLAISLDLKLIWPPPRTARTPRTEHRRSPLHGRHFLPLHHVLTQDIHKWDDVIAERLISLAPVMERLMRTDTFLASPRFHAFEDPPPPADPDSDSDSDDDDEGEGEGGLAAKKEKGFKGLSVEQRKKKKAEKEMRHNKRAADKAKRQASSNMTALFQLDALAPWLQAGGRAPPNTMWFKLNSPEGGPCGSVQLGLEFVLQVRWAARGRRGVASGLEGVGVGGVRWSWSWRGVRRTARQLCDCASRITPPLRKLITLARTPSNPH